MRYLSLAMVAVIVVLSWFLIKTPNDLTADQHARLQEVIKEYLGVYLKETNPAASDIQEVQVFTRVVEPGKKMFAQFKFFYAIPGEGGSVNRIAREGVFLLTSENGDDWIAKMEKINDTYVEFSEALQISLTGGAESSADPEAKPKAEPKKKEAHH